MRNDDPVMKAIILLAASILSIILTLAGCVIAPGLGWLWLVMLVTFCIRTIIGRRPRR